MLTCMAASRSVANGDGEQTEPGAGAAACYICMYIQKRLPRGAAMEFMCVKTGWRGPSLWMSSEQPACLADVSG
jgi:hypothetical protein